MVLGACRGGSDAVVDVLVQVPGIYCAAVDHTDAGLREMPLHRRGRRSGAFEPHLVGRFGVGNVEPARSGVHRHVEQDGAHVVRLDRARESVGVDREDIVVGEVELDVVAPIPIVLIEPFALGRVVLDDEAHLRRRIQGHALVGSGIAAWHCLAVYEAGARAGKAVANSLVGHCGRQVARVEDRHIDGVAIGGGDQRARCIAEELHDLERRPTDRRAQARGVEDPDVGARLTRHGEVRIARTRDAGYGTVRSVLASVK